MDGAPFQTAHNESSVSELELELELPGKKVTLGLSLQMLDHRDDSDGAERKI